MARWNRKEMQAEIADLQHQLQQAQKERDKAERETRWASQFECSVHGTCDWSMVSTAKTCMATLANGQPCKETLQRGSSPWDAAIKRGVQVYRECQLFLAWGISRFTMAKELLERTEAAEGDAAEQRAARVKAKAIAGPLFFRLARDGDGKCFTCGASSACTHAPSCPWGWLVTALFFTPAEALQAKHRSDRDRTPSTESSQSGEEEGGR